MLRLAAPRQNQRDVVILLMRAELPDLVDNRPDGSARRLTAMPSDRFDQAVLAEFLFCVIKGFGDAIGVENQRVSRTEAALVNRAIPLLKQADHSAGGIEPLDGASAPQKQHWQVPAVGIAQAPCLVIVCAEK